MMPINAVDPATLGGAHFDLVVVGSGFGSGFFLHKALQQMRGKRVLVVEWGEYREHAQKLEDGSNSTIRERATYRSDHPKPWTYNLAYGGGTNCWYGQTPRFHPSDFRMKSLYGVGADWPIGYDELEPHYVEAERVMSLSGDPDMAQMFPRSAPFPQPPHRMNAVDRRMKAAQPDRHFVMPTARARVATENRSACCASHRCFLCPVDAKFTANNGMSHVYGHPDVAVALNSRALTYEEAGGAIRALIFEHDGRQYRVTGDLFVLGANAIQSPALMLRSGLGGGATGRGIVESLGANVEVLLDGLDNFDGSTITTGLNFSLYDGPHRRNHGAAMVEFQNRWSHGLRREPGRWRQTAPLIIVVEDLLDDDNRVTVGPDGVPVVTFKGEGRYAREGLERALEKLPEMLAPLPVERILFRGVRESERHIQGTMRMGSDPSTSVVDDRLVHHRYRNLVVVGTAVTPTCSAANPSLTGAALAIRSAALVA